MPNLPSGTSVGQNKNVNSILKRFPIGSYIQIDGEIMRVASNVLTGSNDEITVIRGALGTISPAQHPNGSVIKKIKPLPLELRRPSILRASGHTFEYLGYGPGNYSTALPQLQNRSLTEREEFLSQSQETSCGNVVYTGMNDKGDFYIGNTKISSSSGQQTTFDIPIPTITGEDPNRLSIVADEVIVKERLLVEGGVSKQILSQFDGPVTFNENVRLANPNKTLTSVSNVNITNTTNPTSISSPSALKVAGGVSIGSSVFIGGDLIGSGSPLPNISGITSVTAVSFFGDGAGLTNTGAQLSASGTNGDTQRVTLTHLTTGTMIAATTDAQLTFTSSTNTLSSTAFAGNLTGNVTGNLSGNSTTATTASNVVGTANRVLFNNATDTTTTSSNLTFNGTQLTTNNIIAQNVRISTSGGNEIDTVSGNLILDSAGGTVQVNDTLQVTGNLDVNGTGTHTLAGILEVSGEIRAINSDIVAFSSSDRNLKDNITIIPNALDKINAISGNTFTWKSSGSDYEHFLGKQDTGVIAQEVEALGLPGITTTRDDGTKAVRYDRLIPILIQAVKELSAKVTALEGS